MEELREMLDKVSAEPCPPPSFDDPHVTFISDPPKRIIIDGCILPPSCTPERFRDALQFEPATNDVFICTYPKCGTTWAQAILYGLYNDGRSMADVSGLLDASPMIEFNGAKAVSALPPPRLIKSHLRFEHVPMKDFSKCIFVTRNPKDCLVSYFHHCKGMKHLGYNKTGTMEHFFELFMQGELMSGDYFDYMLSWLPHLHNNDNILCLTYEEMKSDLAVAVEKIATHLGGRALATFEDEAKRATLIENSSFAAMATNSGVTPPQRFMEDGFNFIRKGIVGDWRNSLSEEQSRRLDERFAAAFKTTPIEHWWSDAMKLA